MYFKTKLFITLVLLTLIAAALSPQQSGKKLLYKDASYEEEIRTVRLYPGRPNTADVFQPSTTRVGVSNLTLEFDDLVESHEEYRVKIIHCNYDWKPSGLKTLDYLNDFNEFVITSFEYSTDTKIGYVHYTFRVPPVKVSGNYLLVAYRGSNDKDIILSKRFMVYDQQVAIDIMSNTTGLTSNRRQNQQIDFKVDYENIELINPLERVHIVIRQNQQWYNSITNLKPSFFREGSLEYRFFNFENNFNGGNEFRFFDMRSLRYPGQNIANVNLQKRPSEAYIMNEGARIYQAYAQYDDLNGDYFIQNQDTGGSSESDYLYTTFSLILKEPVAGEVHVVGKMNNYDLNETTKMEYNERTKAYTNTQLLKQGFYNYQYIVQSDTLNYHYLEGNHFETENDYEIFIYYSPPQLRGDVLIGYKQLTLNSRLTN